MTEDVPEKDKAPAAKSAEMGDDNGPPAGPEQQAPAGGSPTTMGKMVIPDLSPLTVGQSENIRVMTAVIKEASQSLAKIMTAQRSVLEATLTNLQVSVQGASGSAGIPSNKIPDLDVQIQNLQLTVDNFSASAETLSVSTTKSFDTLSQSINESLAKIEEVATKFSGG